MSCHLYQHKSGEKEYSSLTNLHQTFPIASQIILFCMEVYEKPFAKSK